MGFIMEYLQSSKALIYQVGSDGVDLFTKGRHEETLEFATKIMCSPFHRCSEPNSTLTVYNPQRRLEC